MDPKEPAPEHLAMVGPGAWQRLPAVRPPGGRSVLAAALEISDRLIPFRADGVSPNFRA